MLHLVFGCIFGLILVATCVDGGFEWITYKKFRNVTLKLSIEGALAADIPPTEKSRTTSDPETKNINEVFRWGLFMLDYLYR